jgi:lipopolysaccharide/colanic/teichoic acid biosynthesis glycosyltransferase
VALLPVLLLVALAVKLSSRGPVMFRQGRVGHGGRQFTIRKLRTMQANAEAALVLEPRLLEIYVDQDHKIPVRLDPRVTRVGRWLRKTSLDELPQLLNVVRGDMSLVGPRPVRPSELPCYGELLPAYLSVRPGLTGLWQVSGRSEVKFPRRAELDADYSLRCSARLDLAILMATPGAVLRGRGAE